MLKPTKNISRIQSYFTYQIGNNRDADQTAHISNSVSERFFLKLILTKVSRRSQQEKKQ